MNKHKNSISQTTSYEEIGKFCDAHNLADFWEKTREEKYIKND